MLPNVLSGMYVEHDGEIVSTKEEDDMIPLLISTDGPAIKSRLVMFVLPILLENQGTTGFTKKQLRRTCEEVVSAFMSSSEMKLDEVPEWYDASMQTVLSAKQRKLKRERASTPTSSVTTTLEVSGANAVASLQVMLAAGAAIRAKKQRTA
jgi:hypothetical protein